MNYKTNEIITEENTTILYKNYKENWINTGLNKYEERFSSENGEDGVILQIFNEIGCGDKYYVEFGAQDGFDISNTLVLRQKHGWGGLLLDCGYENPEINLHKAFISAENILGLFEKYNVPKEFEFLSIDIDGNDYWVLKSILKFYKPKLFVVETNQLLPLDKPLSITYDPDRMWEYESSYFGANVTAFNHIAEQNDYVLICTVDQNAFFLRKDQVSKLTTEIPNIGSVEKIFKPRMPRCFTNPEDSSTKTMTKVEAEDMAKTGEFLSHLVPKISDTMRGGDKDNRRWCDVVGT
jgi:hypothetical protein